MDRQTIIDILEEEANELVPTPVDLWPAVAARLEARSRHSSWLEAVRRWMRMVFMTLLIVTVALSGLAAFPGLPVSTPGSIQQLIRRMAAGISAGLGPTMPVEFRPTPPFTVKQPSYLPAGFERVKITYSPGAGPESGRQLPAGTGAVARGETGPSLPAEVGGGQMARLMIVYRAEDGRQVQLFERAALPDEVLPAGEAATVNGQEATLQTDGQVLTLTWVEGGTWVELRGNLPRRELLKVATGLVTTAVASSAAAPSEGAAHPEQ